MKFAGLGSQEKAKGEEDWELTRKVGSGMFPRYEAIEKVREFDAMQVFD